MTFEDPPKVTIAFGSCNRQNRPQDYWKVIGSHKPSHFLWLGDAVYTKDYQPSSLSIAYDTLLNNSEYRDFADKVQIDGVWDDHDYGVNDGSRHASDREFRQQQYVNFLKGSGSDKSANVLSKQEGLYHSLDISLFEDMTIKVIFLDTRYFRDHNVIPSLGVYKSIPLSALISSAIRGAYSVLGYFREYDGEMLGESQWQWLENTLQTSNADMHILVSGVQVATSNPVFESWGHFPKEQKRLFELLAKYDPKGLMLLSGDVHLSELSTINVLRKDGSKDAWMEVTSSGLTHSSGTSRIQRFLCPIMMRMFQQHRFHHDAYYAGRNFGLLEVEDHESEKVINVNIMSIESNSVQLGWQFKLPLAKAPIERVDYADFVLFSFPTRMMIYLFLFSFVCFFIGTAYKTASKRRDKKD
jgi:alkaline phosphatase D